MLTFLDVYMRITIFCVYRCRYNILLHQSFPKFFSADPSIRGYISKANFKITFFFKLWNKVLLK